MSSFFSKLIPNLFKSDLILPLILLLSYIGLMFSIRGVIPSSKELVDAFSTLYANYGYQIIFVGALLESLILVSFFAPGMVAMGLGAVFARTGQIELPLVIAVASSGLIIGYTIDFLLGFYGFSEVINRFDYGKFLEKAQKQIKRFGKRGLIVGFAYPNVGSFLSFAAGMTKMSAITFLVVTIISTIFWATVWGIVLYSLGDIFLSLITKYSLLIMLIVVCGLFLLAILRSER